MLKKFIWFTLAVALLCCSPLWANNDNPWSEYIYAVNDQSAKIGQFQPLVTGAQGVVTASPLDLCPNTNTCVRLDSTLPCTLPGGFLPGSAMYAFQDPAKACPPPVGCPTYPFEVKAVHVMLTNCQAVSCVAVLRPSILAAMYPTDPNCPVPGNMLCQGPEVTVTILPNQCLEYVLPIKETCCVDAPYFACVEILTTDCNLLEVCTDRSCDTCCNYVRFPGGSPLEACGQGAPGDFALWTDGVLSCQNICPKPPPDTGKNHYKAWRVTPMTLGVKRQVKDQFMTDSLFLQQLEYLSNPVRKIVFGPKNDTSRIIDPDDHLTWYRATGRDTSLKVTYKNQFESTSVCIDSVQYLLVPAQKDGHLPPDSVDHYKAYRIQNPVLVNKGIQLEDQFDLSMGTQENVTSFLPVFFLTPCQKNLEPTYDLITHYVAYEIAPIKNYVGPARQVTDQFLFQRTIDVFNSRFLLVPTQKLKVELCAVPQETCCYPFAGGPPCGPVPVGTCVAQGGVVVPACLGDGNLNGIDDACDPEINLRNHFKTWRVFSPPVDTHHVVIDQFTTHDFLFVDSLKFLSNPTIKEDPSGFYDILRPDDHLSWYRVKKGNNLKFKVVYENQFETTKVAIDSVKYLLLPTQKLNPPHPAPDTLLNHYTAYRIFPAKGFKIPMALQDQFDRLFGQVESIDSVVQRYFLTPAQKDTFRVHNPDTHYVAYEIFPKHPFPGLNTQTIDQYGFHDMQVDSSYFVLVPTRKIKVCKWKPTDCSGDGALGLPDIICLVNVVFKGAAKPVPDCRGDFNCDGRLMLPDIVAKVNYTFKGGRRPEICRECCIEP